MSCSELPSNTRGKNTKSWFYLHVLNTVVFCPLLKKSSGNPYLKILDFSQLLVADTRMIFFSKKFLFTPSDSTFGAPSQTYF